MEKTSPLQIRLDSGTRIKLQGLAELYGVSMSAVVRLLIRSVDSGKSFLRVAHEQAEPESPAEVETPTTVQEIYEGPRPEPVKTESQAARLRRMRESG